jgi:ABC-type sugar transport system ATPase subunit
LFRAEVRAALLLAHSLPRAALAWGIRGARARRARMPVLLQPHTGRDRQRHAGAGRRRAADRAPQNDVVTELSAQGGASFAAGAELCRIATPRSALGHGDANGEIAGLLQARRDSLRADQQASAAQWTALHAEIVAHPMGYQSLLGENGQGLSGGQRQRLLLARALYA